MPFNIQCTKCAKALQVPDEAAGKKVRCPGCGEIIAVVEVLDDANDTGVQAGPSVPAPAPATPTAPATWDDDEEPPSIKKRKPRYDDDDDDERDEEEDDDSSLNIRRPRSEINERGGMANTAMTMGIIAVSLSVVGVPCCSFILLPVGGLLGIFAIVFGFLGSPSRDGQALTGVVCGIIALLLVIVGVILQVFLLRMQLGQG